MCTRSFNRKLVSFLFTKSITGAIGIPSAFRSGSESGTASAYSGLTRSRRKTRWIADRARGRGLDDFGQVGAVYYRVHIGGQASSQRIALEDMDEDRHAAHNPVRNSGRRQHRMQSPHALEQLLRVNIASGGGQHPLTFILAWAKGAA